MSSMLKGKTSSTNLIKQNKDLALWRDITQTKTNKYPPNLYESALKFMESNYLFKDGDINIFKGRYGKGLEYTKICEVERLNDGVRGKLLRILKVLSSNRRMYVGNVFKKADVWEPRTKTNKPSSTTQEMREHYEKGDLALSEYADKRGCRYEKVRSAVYFNKEELKGLTYKIGTATMLKPEAMKILDKHIDCEPKTRQPKNNTQKVNSAESDDAKYLLRARLRIALAMSKENDEFCKREYCRLLKDLNDESERSRYDTRRTKSRG